MFPLNPLLKGGLVCTMLFLAMTGCQRQELPASTIEQPAPKISAKPDPGAVATAATTTGTEPPDTEQERQPAAPLNLDIPQDLLEEQTRTGFPQTEDKRLPDLFTRKKREGTSLSGEIVFEEDEDIAVDTISGAKITINIPTGKEE